MNQPTNNPNQISIDEFLPILMASEVKLELINGYVVPFANGTLAHTLVCERIVRTLRRFAQPGGNVLTSQTALRRSEASTYVFPDASYTRELLEPDQEVIVAPVLVVEVMSPRSVERDRVDKFDTYQALPSIEEYLIIDSRRTWACVYRRSDRTWILNNFGPGDTIELVSMDNARFRMADLYNDAPPSA